MIRSLHKVPGIAAALLIMLLALSGSILALQPALESLSAPALPDAKMTIAELAGRIEANYSGVEQLKRSPSGRITAFYFDGDTPKSVVVDPVTGEAIGPTPQGAFFRWMTDLHRSLFLDDAGRWTAGAGGAAMVLLSISGLALVVRRVGGWRNYFSRLKGPASGRIHVEIARVAVIGLLLSSVTSLWMLASTFGFLPDEEPYLPFPSNVSETAGVPVDAIPLLQQTPVSSLRELVFPYPTDPTDVFTLTTNTGTGFVDQGTGETLVWEPFGIWQKVSETIYMLHTGQGAAWLGLLLGLTALGVPILAVTGVIHWAKARRGRPRLRHNAKPAEAGTILLVASEGGSTWGFAAALHRDLVAAGKKVHTVSLARFAPERYASARQAIILAATYGEGEAPASAAGFLERFKSIAPASYPLAVLGFGDRSFPAYCRFAKDISEAAATSGWEELLPFDTIDRQSSQSFARWSRDLGAKLGLGLNVTHVPTAPKGHALTLVSRQDFGTDLQEPSAILRFEWQDKGLLARLFGRGFGDFGSGDLLGVIPVGSEIPRYYSLASSRLDGFVEICVKRHQGGLCSGQLMALAVGDTVSALVRPNPAFRPTKGSQPVILVGAGTGIGPLAGFIRRTGPGGARHLYYGARHPESDLLYGSEIEAWQASGHLASVRTAFSRTASRAYVQDALRADAERVARLVAEGAQILICGGRDMAEGVTKAIEDIIAPMGLTPAMLRAEGRLAEDVY